MKEVIQNEGTKEPFVSLLGRVMQSMIPRGDKQFLETPWYRVRLMRLVPIYQ